MSLMLKSDVEVSESHFVHFYRDNRFLCGALLEFIKVGIEKSEGIIIIATEPHIQEICKTLPQKIVSETRFVDASWILRNIFPKGVLNSNIFIEQISLVLNEMQGYKRKRIFVEVVDLLCEQKNQAAALELEGCCNKYLHGRKDVVVMCSYNLKNISSDEYRLILDSHSFSSGNEDENSSIDYLCRKIASLEIRNSEARMTSAQAQMSLDLKKRIVHSLKLSDIGEISAGLSHELLNPVTIISSYSQTISMALEDQEFESKEFIKAQIEGINSTVNRMASLVKNVLNYSRVNGCKKDFLVVDAIADAVELLNPLLKSHNVAVQVLVSSDQIYMHGDPVQILQIIFNLLTNARDAITESHGVNGGMIIVRVDATEERFNITCHDNGKGIEPKNLKNIWKPFYTTKVDGKGTGLGLTIIQKIVQDNNGTIECESHPHQGTRFTVTLPRVYRN